MTRPDTLPPVCLIDVDGVRFQDGSPTDDPAAPTALDGLRVTWGRHNTLDQPTPATCTFKVIDRTGGQHYRNVLRIGSRVDVTASATLYPDPTVPMLTDPQFTAAAAGPYPTNAAGRRGVKSATIEAAPAGGQQLRLAPTNPLTSGAPGTITWGPAPVTGPTSWDAAPQAKAGQSWTFGATVAVAAGIPATVLVRPVEFTAANLSTGWRYCPGDPAVTRAWTGGPVTISGTVQPTAGTWVGLQIVVLSIGRAWRDVAPALTWETTDPAWTWTAVGSVAVDDLLLLAPAAGTDRVGRLFSGRITDLAAEWSIDAAAAQVTVICQDDTAELENRYVGETPWLLEGLGARASKIVAASGQPITLTTDATVAGVKIAARDVDAQGAASLLQSLAQSVAGALWNAASVAAGSFLRIEDVNARPPMLKLVIDAGSGLVIIAPVDSQDLVESGGLTLDACELLLETTGWIQTTEDDSTRVAVTWTDAAVPPAEHTETVVDSAAEALSGRRRVSLQTELTTQADAIAVGSKLLARLTTPGWRVDGLTWSMLLQPIDADILGRVMKVLDGVTRIGLPVLIVNLPDWSAISGGEALPLYLEGGIFTYSLGGWTLELMTSSARAQGLAGVAWQDLPATAAWQWQDFDLAISWGDLAGVGI